MINTENLIDYLNPVNIDEIIDLKRLNINQLGNQIAFYSNQNTDLSQYNIGILGVQSNASNNSLSNSANKVRHELYQLFSWTDNMKVVDLGNVNQGKTVNDTCAALETILQDLLAQNLFCIIIGDDQDLSYVQYKAYENLDKKINVVVVDEKIDIDDHFDVASSNQFYINKILAHKPSHLFNYLQLAYQSFLVNPYKVELLRKKSFECYRLGYLLEDMKRLEPMLRNADMLSLDISSIKYGDAPGQKNHSPNGFSAPDMCRIGRYAGLSDTLSSFGFYEYLVDNDTKGLTAQVIAQCIWYFIGGYYERNTEDPTLYNSDNIRYNVSITDKGEEIVFHKSKRTGRWWMQVPLVHSEDQPYVLVPCTEEEYKIACKREIPDRWLQALMKYSQ